MTLITRLFAARHNLKVPVTTTDITVHRDVKVRAPDGTVLLTDAYVAAPGRPLPAILIRTPYGRRGDGAITARLFAERGYHAVLQSTRGTFGSGGRLDFDAEAADGRAAADWITAQPWSDGTIGTFGASYLTFTQFALASTRPPQLKAMAIAVWPAERRAYHYPGGAFALDRLAWAYTLEHQEKRLAFVHARARNQRKALTPAFGHLPLRDADTVAVGHPAGYFQDAIEHDKPGDPYWEPSDFRPVLAGLGVPVTMLAGWYDVVLPQMLADYQLLRDNGQRARLTIGGWHHTSRELYRQELTDALDWFGTHLLGRPPADRADLRMEVMGGGGWHDLAEWPPPGTAQRWHLHPDGALGPAAPAPGEPDRYVYDPADPTPAVGGTSVVHCGPRDNRALEQRPDVLTYTSAPLDEPLVITGPVTVQLFAGSSRPHTDFFARLCDVGQDGVSVNITDGIRRVDGATEQPGLVTIELWSTAYQFRAGHRVRLQVSSGAHPRYARNPGGDEPLATAVTLHTARQAVYHDPARPSAVLLPVVTAAGRKPR
jgi:putative CocE/NonD family hydrolase